MWARASPPTALECSPSVWIRSTQGPPPPRPPVAAQTHGGCRVSPWRSHRSGFDACR
jgi:hypothetical protein